MKSQLRIIFMVGISIGWTPTTVRGGDQYRETISARIKQQEQLVQSIECEFDCIVSPTRPDMIATLRQSTQGKEALYSQYYISEMLARNWSYSAHWLRKGEKERYEKRPLGHTDETPIVQAFDGNVVRQLTRNKSSLAGIISTIDRSHWHSAARDQPYYFLFEDHATAFSDIIGKGKDYSFSEVTIAGKHYTRINVRHPTVESQFYYMLFDRDNRLVERRAIVKWTPRTQPEENHRLILSDYRSFQDSSGERIWFPMKVVIHRYSRKLPTGIQVEYETSTFTIKSIKFNVPIPDSQFTIELPPGTKVYDRITGTGLSPTLDTSVWTSPPSLYPWWKRRWVIIAGTAILLTLLGAVVILLRRRKSRQSLTGTGP